MKMKMKGEVPPAAHSGTQEQTMWVRFLGWGGGTSLDRAPHPSPLSPYRMNQAQHIKTASASGVTPFLYVQQVAHTHTHTRAPRRQNKKAARTQKHKAMNSALRRLDFLWDQRKHLRGTAASTFLKSTEILLYLCCRGESILFRSRTQTFGSTGGLIKDLLVVLGFIHFSYPFIYLVKHS